MIAKPITRKTSLLPPQCHAYHVKQLMALRRYRFRETFRFGGDYLDDIVGGARHGVHDDACDGHLLLVRDGRAARCNRWREGRHAVVAGKDTRQ